MCKYTHFSRCQLLKGALGHAVCVHNPMKGDYKLHILKRLCWRANLIASIFAFHSNLAQETCARGNSGVRPWDWPLPEGSPRAQSYQSTAKPAYLYPCSSPCLHSTAAGSRSCWTGWATQQAKWELCQPVQYPEIAVRAKCKSLPCLNQVVAWRACRLPKFTQENRRWAAPNCS